MKSKLKRAVSALLAVAVLCTMLIIPAAAADTDKKLGFTVEEGSSEDIYVVNIIVEGDSSQTFDMYSGEIYVHYDSSLLSLVGSSVKGKIPDVENPYGDDYEMTGEVSTNTANYVIITLHDNNSVNHSVSYNQSIVTLTFKAVENSERETCTTELTFDVPSENKINIIGYYDDGNQNYTIDSSATQSVTIKGISPIVGTVSLTDTANTAVSAVSVDGENAEPSDISIAVASKQGTSITNFVDFTVTKDDEETDDVKVENGKVVVDPLAAAGTYTITATGDGTNATDSAAATLTVTHTGMKATTVEVSPATATITVPGLDASGNAGTATKDFTATVKDQFGDTMSSESVTWSLDPAVSGVSVDENGVVTVTTSAMEAPTSFDVVATSSTNVFGKATVTLEKPEQKATTITLANTTASVEVPALQQDGSAGSTTAANQLTPTVKDQFGYVMNDATVTWSGLPEGVSIGTDGTVTVTTEAVSAVSSTPIELTATYGDATTTATLTLTRAEAVAASINLYADGAVLGESDSIGIPGEKTYSAKVYDQYGLEMENQAVTWALSESVSGISVDDAGKVTVDSSTEDNATVTLTATVTDSDVSATLNITVVALTVNWPTVTEAITSPTHADQWSSILTFDASEGSAIDMSGSTVTGTFSMEVTEDTAVASYSAASSWPDGYPRVGTYSYHLVFESDDGMYLMVSSEEHSSGTVEIAKAPLTLDVSDLTVTKEFDGTSSAGTASGTLALTGVVDGDEVTAPEVSSISVGAYSDPAIGTYTVTLSGITASGADANQYTLADTYDTTATITKIALKENDFTFTAPETDPVYDGTSKAVTVEAAEDSNVAADDFEVKFKTEGAEDTADYVDAIDAGNYDVYACATESGNYSGAIKVGTLTIAKATRTIGTDAQGTLLIPGSLSATLTVGGDIDHSAKITSVPADSVASVAVTDAAEGTSASATITAVGNGTREITLAIPASTNYEAFSRTVTVYAVPNPLTAFTASAGDYTLTGSISGTTIALSGMKPEDTAIDTYSATYPTISGVTFSGAASSDGSTFTVTISAGGLTGSVSYTIDATTDVVAGEAKVEVVKPVPDTSGITENQAAISDALNDAATTVKGMIQAITDLINEVFDTTQNDNADADVTVKVGLKIAAQTPSTIGSLTAGLTINITPVYSIVVDGSETVTEQPISNSDITQPMRVNIKLPETTPFQNATADNLVARHHLSNGYEYFDVDYDSTTRVVSWDQDTFSVVDLYVNDIEGVNVTFDPDGGTLVGTDGTEIYTAANLSEALPKATKTNFSFNGWQINGSGTIYTTVEEDILAAGSNVTLVASYTRHGGGSSSTSSDSSGSSGSNNVTINSASHGKVTASSLNPKEGATVTLTVTPSNGYELASMTVTINRNGEEVELSPAISRNVTEYTFTMPQYPVTVKPKFQATDRVVVDESDYGSVSVSDANPKTGDTVTLTVAPDSGCEFKSITVKDSNGKTVEVQLVEGSSNRYTFTMPSGNVVVSAKFEQTYPGFDDVDEGDWFYDMVKQAYMDGLMNGVGKNLFDPNGNTTRAMVVTILYRIDGEPEQSDLASFPDVPAGQWYSKAVAWASANGVVNGYSDGNFGPTDSITREQMAAILYRYADMKGYDVSEVNDLSAYTDEAQINDYAKDAMGWANAAGLITGKTTTTLAPKGNATRAEVATILVRFCENVVNAD